jgi:hypothetical protein
MAKWNDLFSPKEDVALDAIQKASEVGTVEWVRPLLEAVRDHPSEAVKQSASNVLSTLKISAAEDVLADALNDPEFEGLSADIITYLWSCGFHSEELLPDVVRCAVQGDFRSAMEALTWVEQIEGISGEHDLLESILVVRGGLEDEALKDIHGLLTPLLDHLHRLERGQ